MIEELEKYITEKLNAIKNIKNILGDKAKELNPNIDGLEEAYNDVYDKIHELMLNEVYLDSGYEE